MRWRGGRRSENVEDLRGASMPAGGLGGASSLIRLLPFLVRTKVGRILLILGVVAYFGAQLLGVDLLQSSAPPPTGAASQLSAQDQELVEFVSVVLAETEQMWHMKFGEMNRTYREPKLVLFRTAVRSACGYAEAATGPFYCPGDQKLYLDLAFFEAMKKQLGAPGDFAQAYVIAHEVGHHVQTLLGTSGKVRQAQQRLSREQANQLSVRLELQADCYAGMWGHYADRERQIVETGDLEEAINAASAIGDDTLQKQSGGPVRPESFTHGSSTQRMEWFRRGFEAGRVDSCDTFRDGL